MDCAEKQCLSVKIKAFTDLNNVFDSFIEVAKQFITNDENNTFGLKVTNKNNLTCFHGFGHLFFASWRFLIHDNKPTGELCFYRISEVEKEKFFSVFYESKGNAKKNIDDKVTPYFLKDDKKFENLFFDLIKSFFELDCFKV